MGLILFGGGLLAYLCLVTAIDRLAARYGIARPEFPGAYGHMAFFVIRHRRAWIVLSLGFVVSGVVERMN